jgi:hypothetical protein
MQHARRFRGFAFPCLKRRNQTFIHAIATALLGGAVVACAAERPQDSSDEQQIGEVQQAVLVGSSFEPWSPPPAWAGTGATTCTEYYTNVGGIALLNEAGRRIQTILDDVVKRGRMAAYSFAMGDCLSQVMVNGNILFRHDTSNPTPAGPYCRPLVDPNCDANTATVYQWSPNTDPYNPDAFSALSLADVRVAQARRVWALAASNAPLKLGCHKPLVTNGPKTQFVVSDSQPEILSLRQDEYAGLLTDSSVNERSYMAGLIWHEVFHGFGYDHSNNKAANFKSVPLAVGECIWQVLLNSSQAAPEPQADTSCQTTTCGPNQLPIVNAFPGNACVCMADPNNASARVATNVGAPGPVVVDGSGFMYRINGGAIQTYLLGLWLDIGLVFPEQIYAGGTYVFYRRNGNLFRRDGAGWTNLGSAGSNVVIDSVGQAYRRLGTTVQRVRPGSTTWVSLTGQTSFSASRIFAGGDKVFATDFVGDIHRWSDTFNGWFKIGGPGFDFAVDSYGVLYGLGPDRSYVAAFRNGTWSIVGGPAEGIVAGHRLYGRNTANEVYELHPNGSWAFVTNGYTGWSAGGARVVVKRSGNWTAYIPSGTNGGLF